MESRSLIDVLYSKKVPFTLIDKSYNFYDQFICRDLLAYLRLSINPYSKEDFLRIINRPFRYISGRILTKIKGAYIDEDLFDYLVDEFEMPNFQIKKIKELKKDIKYFNKTSLQYAINTIVNDLHYYDYLIEYSEKMKIPMEELESVLEEFKLAASKHTNIVSFLTYVNEIGEELKKNDKKNKNSLQDENEVTLSTIHGVKGMEFKNVFVINCNEENIPHGNALEENNIEEERRLFYVAITRAKEKLYLGYTNEIRGVSKKVSRFINECNLVEVKNLNEFKEGDEINHKYFGEGKIYKIVDGTIKIKFLDDKIKSFKKDIIINNGVMKKKLD
ncbi:3'-5' exonuclease [Clostridium sp. DL1XJH146]